MTKKRIPSLLLSALLASSTLACAPEGDDTTAVERIQQLDADLSLGATGEDARAVNDHLARSGYLPNAALASKFPSWRPVIAKAPTDPATFDDQTRLALLAYQGRMGLDQTGVVDAPTRELLRKRHCGVPEGQAPLDASEKFSMINGGLGRRNLTWRLGQLGGTMDFNQVSQAAAASFAVWAAQGSGVSFQQVFGGSSNILIQFAAISPDTIGQTSGQTITMNSLIPFNNVPGSFNDLQSPLIHEIGHALGIHHSAWGNAKMFPADIGTRFLSLDDSVAATALYDIYTQLPGSGRDIGIGANGDVWLTGGGAIGANFGIFKFNFGTGNWDQTTDGSAAVRVAVLPDGRPVVVQASGAIFVRNSNSPFFGGFTQLNGLAKDVGVGANGEIWITNTTPVNGGFQVAKFNGSTFTPSNGGAVKVSVSATGIPWIVAASGAVFRHSNNSATSGSWEPLSGVLNDIGVGPNHPSLNGQPAIPFVWSVATNSSGFENLSAWAEQPPGGSIPLSKGWLSGIAISTVSNSTNAVAVDPSGQPWIIDAATRIFRSVR